MTTPPHDSAPVVADRGTESAASDGSRLPPSIAQAAPVPFAAARVYRRLGWTGTLPLPPAAKGPPPPGFTGHDGGWPTPDDLGRWARDGYVTGRDGNHRHHAAHNLALRLPPSMIGFDVDNYGDKHGADTLHALEDKLGPLPPTVRSTSRDDGVSGIYLYRVPAGLVWPTEVGLGVEIIRYAHRYMLVEPALHPEGRRPYRWLDADGEPVGIPTPGGQPELPTTWVQYLTGTGTDEADGTLPLGGRARRRSELGPAREWLRALDAGEPCAYVGRVAADALAAARREDGAAYDATRDAVLALLRAAERGHPGVGRMLPQVRTAYVGTVGGDRGGTSVAGGEFDRFTETGAATVLGTPTAEAERGCRCWPPQSSGAPTSSADGVSEGMDSGPQRKSQATRLVELALARYRVLLGGDGRPYAVALDGPNIARPLRGRSGLREQLAKAYTDSTGGSVPSASALADALAVLDGHARDCDPEPVELRLATHGDGIVLDLGTADGRCVLVGPDGWRIEARSPVLFRRTALTGPLPNPEHGGTLDPLRGLLNVNDDAWHLLLGWSVAALLPRLPHPILALLGEQGSAKSTTARLLVDLLDPSPAPLRSCPRDLRQWAVTAAASWTVALDNVSSIPGWLSDILCRAVTGDGIVDRALYTDDDVAVLSFRRVVALTSIDAGALSGDLAERLLPVELDRIPAGARRTEADIDAAFTAARPELLGALLDLLVQVLAALPTVRLVELPRMADFGRLLAALDVVLGSHTIKTYTKTAEHVAEMVVESDPFAEAVRTLATKTDWEGTATELRDRLTPEKPPRGWPRSARAVSGALRRVVPALRATGVEVSFERVGGDNRSRNITLSSRTKGDGRDGRDGRDANLALPSVQVISSSSREPPTLDTAEGSGNQPSIPSRTVPSHVSPAQTGGRSRDGRGTVRDGRADARDANDSADAPEDRPVHLTSWDALWVTQPDAAAADGRADATPSPPEPAPCKVCGVLMSVKRSGTHDRCEACWADLLAAQPDRGGAS